MKTLILMLSTLFACISVGPETIDEVLTDKEKENLLHMRAEEKLARDVYTTLGAKWDHHIFDNIGAAEQRHSDLVKGLIDKFNLADPVVDDEVGVFSSSDIQALYDRLTSQGAASLVDALTVGATIEDMDLYDLANAIAETEHEDLLDVYQKLYRGSENHMRAFSRQLERNGADYTPQYISQETYAEILSDNGKGKAKGAKSTKKCKGEKCDKSKCGSKGDKKKCKGKCTK